MSDFDLRSIVRGVLDEGGCDSFRDYSIKVLDLIPAKDLKAALLACLPDYVRGIDHRPLTIVPTRGTHASSKVQAIGNAWAAFIARHIATEQGTQIPLALANEGQVRFYAGLLRVKAMEVSAKADAFEQIADLMASRKAGRVKDLPPSIAADAMKAAA